jgi:predicted acetyltransferase
VERLWPLFQHDLSEFRGELPRPDGTFRSERVESAFTKPGWEPYVFADGDRPAGFAIVRGPDGPARVLNSFFVVRGARGAGLGARALREIVTARPGAWEIAFQDGNVPAARFWPRAVSRIVGGAWTMEHRAVPDRPDLMPDTWISFRAG